MIQVEVTNLVLVNMGKEYIILLKSSIDSRTLPISIGQLEAQSIAIQINDVPFPRPLTHDLFKTVLSEFDCRLKHIVIRELSDETFYADLVLENRGRQVKLDCRPSDAIAIALRCAAPLFVEEKVMNEAGVIIPEHDQPETFEENKPVTIDEDDTQLSPLEHLNKQLKNAITEERYEDAAKFRDEIDRLSNSN
ncbi:MAG TPA: bifunctional nuclease family protein [Chitinispirillaceae bacterium]|nr:bifunctional nuclease family protein [Chitinispirillaceae bacterium]